MATKAPVRSTRVASAAGTHGTATPATPTAPDTPPGTAAAHPEWPALKAAVAELRTLQSADGSIDASAHDLAHARRLVADIRASVGAFAAVLPHDAGYLAAVSHDFERWAESGFGVPDFLDALLAFRPELDRTDGREHLVVFPMYTQNGNPHRNIEAVLLRVVWPDPIAELEATAYDNAMFVPLAFTDFTAGYDTDSAVLFPETIAVREVPRFTWGGIFCDREAARFRRVTAAAAECLHLDLPDEARTLVDRQQAAQDAFVLWDLVHDRTHMRGHLPFDPFMVKQRMPYWMYALEELRCDLTAFREAVRLERQGTEAARHVQYAIVFDRLFRFPVTGDRVRNYDGLGGQLLFAYLHRDGVLRWHDGALTLDWRRLPGAVIALGDEVDELYRQGVNRSRLAHWLAAYELVSSYVPPHPGSTWAKGPDALPLDGPPKHLVDAVMPDEFPLNMFYEGLRRRLTDVIASTRGIVGGSVR
ncbi:DUF6421 family protein [Yinghuangia sp. ASG 101]|uniref:DUF6421 family protein n=1 Tax=Yinghuangia sp. ASG 101 TaxID=2896848 RepID=UPI001E5590DE|nr:DUF6421 family protein [Yinghuangia sp. ASG 101]UGQ10874.1 DUF6421 family protein [Yinghuangia sp. ASG 101]